MGTYKTMAHINSLKGEMAEITVEITLNSPQMGSPERPQGFPLFISQEYKIARS